jgi:hypothetical protein
MPYLDRTIVFSGSAIISSPDGHHDCLPRLYHARTGSCFQPGNCCCAEAHDSAMSLCPPMQLFIRVYIRKSQIYHRAGTVPRAQPWMRCLATVPGRSHCSPEKSPRRKSTQQHCFDCLVRGVPFNDNQRLSVSVRFVRWER